MKRFYGRYKINNHKRILCPKNLLKIYTFMSLKNLISTLFKVLKTKFYTK